jgi:nicotinamide-nucleotide amidase
MVVELVNTGTELMLGRVLNTHQQWLCRQLSDLGYRVTRQVAVADKGPEIEQAVREGLSRADLVITTGGLGPTSDDLTRDLIAGLLGRKLREDAGALRQVQHFFEIRGRPMTERSRLQALVPEGSVVLANAFGTAPGLAIEVGQGQFRSGPGSSWLIMLPGPPRELRPMFKEVVAPFLGRVLPVESAFVCRTLRTTGIGESLVQEQIGSSMQPLVDAGLDLGYCARTGQVDVRLAAEGPEAERMVADAEKIVREQLGEGIFGTGDEEIEAVVVRLLTERKETLVLAESCTGGGIANRVTNVPGASLVFRAGLVTYSNEAKQELLGVSSDDLAGHGAVSEPVARQMAEGARKRFDSDYALSVTGIAGPGGGTSAKPVGTAFIGLAGPFETVIEKNFNPYDRETFKQVTAQQALELLRRKIGRLD